MAQKGKQGRNKRTGYQGAHQNREARTLDKLAEFEAFDKSILPQLKKMVLENWAPDKIRRHFAPMLQARMIERGLSGDFKAIKDTLDRHEGLAVQRIEQKTLHMQMSKKELAALALQKLRDAGIIDTTGKVIKEVSVEDAE